MREALWGLNDGGGYYFHDDFIIDGNKITKGDLLLFSRGIPTEPSRLKLIDNYEDLLMHADLSSLPIRISSLFLRIIPMYFVGGAIALVRNIVCALSLY